MAGESALRFPSSIVSVATGPSTSSVTNDCVMRAVIARRSTHAQLPKSSDDLRMRIPVAHSQRPAVTSARMVALALLFLATAVLYAAVGFGGGSTYNALLVLADTDYRVLPSVALLCNLIVVTGGVWHYRRSGDLSLSFALPFIALSVPMAWLGGRMPIRQETFVLVLGFSLLVAGLAMWVQSPESTSRSSESARASWLVGVPAGGAIGFVSGMVGIGGGIFLAPLLHLLRLDRPKAIAATSSFFIMVNSVAGLVGQTMKQGTTAHLDQLTDYVWLFAAVLVGGQIGSRLSTRALSGRAVKRMTAILVLYVAGRLLWGHAPIS